ncbi:MAG: tRNA 4-thiouridine(8) synthase ThiI [Clostridiales bacterium]|nr:tRNA 4-thiouridine(8) synthase ThiI [Clostridiales bacterium]
MREGILVRYGEVGLKGQQRSRFEKALVREILRATGLPPQQVERTSGRIWLWPREEDMPEVLAAVTRVFGVVSASPVLEVEAHWDAMVKGALLMGERAKAKGALTFKVEARRSGKTFPLTSPEIAQKAGAVLARELNWPVDIHHPEATITIEVREKAYVFSETVAGPGGLPLGTAGRGMLLLSGGIDSPVAGWLAARRGLYPIPVYFYTPPFTSPWSWEKVKDIVEVLAKWMGPLPLYTVPFTKISQGIFARAPERLGTILMRRFMVRVAGRLAEREGAQALITGENLGQVASQTLESMAVVEEASPLMVLRPLLTFDKQEIIQKAREIGTYDISIRPYLDCCNVFLPRRPATRPSLEEVLRAEEGLPVEEWVEEAVAQVERQDIPALQV